MTVSIDRKFCGTLKRGVRVAAAATLLASGSQAMGADAALNPEAVNRFLDTFLVAQLDAHDIPGALAVVATRDGMLTARGVGYADIATQRRWLIDQDIVPIASISKLFIAVSVMQQVERGRLSLDQDINRYLDGWTLRNPYGGPITLEHLLTHRSGLEDKFFRVAMTEKPDLRPLQDILRLTPPSFVYPAGTLSAYSNYGSALAGDIAARAAKSKSYDDYVDAEIFKPLEMRSSSSRRPAPDALERRLAKGYSTKGDLFSPSFEGFNNRTAPSGSVITTAADMSNFMAMLLNGGRFRDQQILTSDSVAKMLGTVYRPHPALTGIGLIAYEKRFGAIRGVGHGGDGFTHHTDLTIFPEQGVGLFLVYLSNKGPDVRNELTRAFVKEFLQTDAPADSPITAVALPAGDSVAGTYRWYRSNFTTVEKIAQLGSELAVSALDGQRIALASSLGNRVYVHTGDGVFRNPYDSGFVTLTSGSDGRILLRVEGYPFLTGFKLRGYETARFFRAFATGLTLLSALLALVGWRRRRELGWYVALLAAAVTGYYPALAGLLSVYGEELYLGLPALGYVLLVWPVLLMVGAAWLVYSRMRSTSAVSRGLCAVLVLVILVQFAHLWQWHLVGFQFD